MTSKSDVSRNYLAEALSLLFLIEYSLSLSLSLYFLRSFFDNKVTK